MTLTICHVQIDILVGDTKHVKSHSSHLWEIYHTRSKYTKYIYVEDDSKSKTLSLNFHCLDRAKCYFQAWGSTKERHDASTIPRGQSGEGPLGSDRLVSLGLL